MTPSLTESEAAAAIRALPDDKLVGTVAERDHLRREIEAHRVASREVGQARDRAEAERDHYKALVERRETEIEEWRAERDQLQEALMREAEKKYVAREERDRYRAALEETASHDCCGCPHRRKMMEELDARRIR